MFTTLNLQMLMTLHRDLADEDFSLLEYTLSSPWLFWLFASVKACTRVLGREANLTLPLLSCPNITQINQYERMGIGRSSNEIKSQGNYYVYSSEHHPLKPVALSIMGYQIEYNCG